MKVSYEFTMLKNKHYQISTIPSKIMKFNELEDKFETLQTITTRGAKSIKKLEIFGEVYLIIANRLG